SPRGDRAFLRAHVRSRAAPEEHRDVAGVSLRVGVRSARSVEGRALAGDDRRELEFADGRRVDAYEHCPLRVGREEDPLQGADVIRVAEAVDPFEAYARSSGS